MAEVVIAVRGGPSAKSRCALAPLGGAALAMAMLADMLDVAGQVSGVTRVHVVTPTDEAARLAAAMGASVILEPAPQGLNAAFERARRAIAARRPAATLALLPGDLPLLEPAELERVLRFASEEAVVVSPATADGGTGALVLRAAEPLAFAFGPDSFRRHIAAVHALDLTPRVVIARGLGLDLDRPADIAAVLADPRATRTAACLRGQIKGAAA